MKHLALLAALLLAGFSAFGTTVTGIVANITGDAFTTNLLFTPTPLPGTSGGSVVAGSAKLVVATNGVFSTELVGGRYTVRINPRAPFVIWVPSSGSYALSQLYKDANGGVVPADAPFLPVTGGDVSGNIRFSGALSGGVIPPYLTTAQRNALNVVSNGMTIWNVSTAEVQVYQSGVWTNLAGGGGGSGITFTTASNAAFALRSIIVDTNAGANYSVTNLNAITYIRNTNAGAGEVSTAQLNTASNALFGASSFTNTLYVAPWGNDSTATRGSIDKPYTLSNAFVQVRNNERIAVMGSNYVGVRVPLPIGSSYVVSNVITAPLFLSNKANITISGLAGGGIYWNNYGTVATYFKTTNIITENLIWDGLTKLGAGTNGFASTVTILESADGLVFRGNTFKNFTAQGIYALNQLFDGYSHVRNVWITDNYFNNIGDQNYGLFGDGTAIVPNGDNWIVSRNIFDNLLRGIEHYNPPGSYGTQYGHVYSDNVMSNIWHVGIFQLNEGSHSNTLGGLKIHGNTISMSKSVVGNVSNQIGGIELRGPLKDATVQGNTIEGTNTLAAFGIVASAANGSVDGLDIYGNTVRGFAFRGYQITANSSTNTMKNGRIFGNTAMFGGNGIQIRGTDMIVGYNTIEDYGDYGIYVEGPSSGVQVFGNIMAGGGIGNYVEATATNVVFQNNFDRGKFAATGDATPTLTDLGVGTKTEQNWPYNNFQIPGTNTAGYLNVQFVSVLNDLRASASYLTNVSIYNAVDFVASKAANSNNRFLTLSNTANANAMWDALMNHAGWLSWYQPVYGNYGIIQHTNGNVSLGDYNSGNFTNYGTVLLKGNATNGTPTIYLSRNTTTGAIEDSYVPSAGAGDVTTAQLLVVSNQLTTASNFFNARQGGSLVLTNLAATGALTNGLVGAGGVMLTTNAGHQVVITGSSGSTNLMTLASGSITAGDVIVTNSVSAGTLTITNLAITFDTVLVSDANTNLTLNFNRSSSDIYLTNSTTTFTNIAGLVSTNQLNLTLRITPVGANRSITWPTLGGSSFGARFYTNANSPIWTTITNPVVVSMSAWGTNVHISMSEWK